MGVMSTVFMFKKFMNRQKNTYLWKEKSKRDNYILYQKKQFNYLILITEFCNLRYESKKKSKFGKLL